MCDERFQPRIQTAGLQFHTPFPVYRYAVNEKGVEIHAGFTRYENEGNAAYIEKSLLDASTNTVPEPVLVIRGDEVPLIDGDDETFATIDDFVA